MPHAVSPTPKYYAVKEELRRLAAEAGPDALLPTERALATRHNTSRTTVRQAIAELVAEGVLFRRQGKGTFVSSSRPTYLRQLTSLSEDARAQGMEIGSRTLAIEPVTADADLAAQLRVPLDSDVTRIDRVRLINGEPLAHEAAYIPGLYPNLPGQLEEHGSLYAVLSTDYGIEVFEAEDTVGTMVAGPEDARLLGIEMGAPLLLIHRRGLSAEGVPVEWTRSVFRGDRFRFFARTRR